MSRWIRVAALAAAVTGASPVNGATIVVDDVSGAPSSPTFCTLRAAIAAANTNAAVGGCVAGDVDGTDVVQLPVFATISFSGITGSAITVTSSIEIDGRRTTLARNAGNCSIDQAPGLDEFRLVSVEPGGSLLVRLVAFSNGCADDAAGSGGAIDFRGDSLVTENAWFIGNRARRGGAISIGAGAGPVSIRGGLMQSNMASSVASVGGAIATASGVDIRDVAFILNDAQQGGAIGATQVAGDAFRIVVRNASFWSNAGGSGAGGIGVTSTSPGIALDLQHVGMHENFSGGAGAIRVAGPVAIRIKNALFGFNPNACDFGGNPVQYLGTNLSDGASCGLPDTPDAFVERMDDVRYDGRRIVTPGFGSSAIDAATDCADLDGGPTTDIRGNVRPLAGSEPRTQGRCDPGPVEIVLDTPVVVAGPASRAAVTDLPITFSSANGNAITITDPEAEARNGAYRYRAENGTFTLASLDGLVCGPDGAGTLCNGTLAAINAALDGAVFLGNPGFSGNATLVVTSSEFGGDRPSSTGGVSTLTIPITVAPQMRILEIAPSPVDFGAVPVGGSARRVVTVTNTGNRPVTTIAPSLIGAGTQFVLTSACPAALDPGGSCEGTLDFVPAAAGPASAGLRIASTAAGSPQLVALDGIGITQLIFGDGFE